MFDPTQGLFFFFLLIHLFHRCVVGGRVCLSCCFLEYSDMFLCVYVVGFFFFLVSGFSLFFFLSRILFQM